MTVFFCSLIAVGKTVIVVFCSVCGVCTSADTADTKDLDERKDTGILLPITATLSLVMDRYGDGKEESQNAVVRLRNCVTGRFPAHLFSILTMFIARMLARRPRSAVTAGTDHKKWRSATFEFYCTKWKDGIRK